MNVMNAITNVINAMINVINTVDIINANIIVCVAIYIVIMISDPTSVVGAQSAGAAPREEASQVKLLKIA